MHIGRDKERLVLAQILGREEVLKASVDVPSLLLGASTALLILRGEREGNPSGISDDGCPVLGCPTPNIPHKHYEAGQEPDRVGTTDAPDDQTGPNGKSLSGEANTYFYPNGIYWCISCNLYTNHYSDFDTHYCCTHHCSAIGKSHTKEHPRNKAHETYRLVPDRMVRV